MSVLVASIFVYRGQKSRFPAVTEACESLFGAGYQTQDSLVTEGSVKHYRVLAIKPRSCGKACNCRPEEDTRLHHRWL